MILPCSQNGGADDRPKGRRKEEPPRGRGRVRQLLPLPGSHQGKGLHMHLCHKYFLTYLERPRQTQTKTWLILLAMWLLTRHITKHSRSAHCMQDCVISPTYVISIAYEAEVDSASNGHMRSLRFKKLPQIIQALRIQLRLLSFTVPISKMRRIITALQGYHKD